MMVYIKEVDYVADELDYDNAKIISYEDVDDIVSFTELIQILKKNKKELFINELWYEVEDYTLRFPALKSGELLCLYVYVTSL